MDSPLNRVLVYSHNAIGLGHAFRTLAVIAGIRRWRPDIEWLVVTGTSVPQVFLDEGIEVIKLPSLRLDRSRPGADFAPRYLPELGAPRVLQLRQRLIMDAYRSFEPQAVFVEHYVTGLQDEILPLLDLKRRVAGPDSGPCLVHLCRGIMRGTAAGDPDQSAAETDWRSLVRLYDLIYVFEDRAVVDVNREYWGDDPELESRIHYLGRIANRTRAEIPDARATLESHGLAGRRVVLMTLGRHGRVFELAAKLFDALEGLGLGPDYRVVMIVDPYLERDTVQRLRRVASAARVLFMPFFPFLVDLIAAADLVVARAGYNTVNEVLLTGARTLLVPESHPSGEQERRARALSGDNVVVMDEDAVLNGDPGPVLADLLSRPRADPGTDFDRFAIGRRIARDLETWTTR
jgi:predicted glycosyltransferase